MVRCGLILCALNVIGKTHTPLLPCSPFETLFVWRGVFDGQFCANKGVAKSTIAYHFLDFALKQNVISVVNRRPLNFHNVELSIYRVPGCDEHPAAPPQRGKAALFRNEELLPLDQRTFSVLSLSSTVASGLAR